MNVNKFVKIALKTGLYLLEQSDKATADMRERLKDRINDQIEDLTDRTREAFSPEDHRLRNVLSLAAGVGVGVAIGNAVCTDEGRRTPQLNSREGPGCERQISPALLLRRKGRDRYDRITSASRDQLLEEALVLRLLLVCWSHLSR